MDKPSIGRIVIVDTVGPQYGDQENAALVAKVDTKRDDDTDITAWLFPPNGTPVRLEHVPYAEKGRQDEVQGHTWRWPEKV